MAYANWPLGVCLPLALLLVWLPRLASRPTPAVASADSDSLGELTRDLSYATSHNALSAAGVAFSVKQLASKLQSQLDAAAQIVSSAERVIDTEQTTSQLSQQALGSASEARQSSAEGHAVLSESISRMPTCWPSMRPSRRPVPASTDAGLP